MGGVQSMALLIGRILLAGIFVIAGYSKIGNFAGTVSYIASKGLPLPEAGAVLAIAVELGAGVLLILGLKTRWAAIALAAFTLASTYFFHAFWAMPEAQKAMQSLMFQKNMAIIGGLLALAVAGAGAFSIDRR
jgi:putative oxidoreductase